MTTDDQRGPEDRLLDEWTQELAGLFGDKIRDVTGYRDDPAKLERQRELFTILRSDRPDDEPT